MTSAPDQNGDPSSFSKLTATLLSTRSFVTPSPFSGPIATFLVFELLFGSLTQNVYSRSLMETDSTCGSFSLSAFT